ncbi:CHAT domain-containing protein [Geitlerinema sp. PCC 7407]|uniref:nSTAND1 domain-containing NTPase n=1 Tax=Geitlerinema sp. PCC 7407 TaxID=1173025 RepID=UPI00029FEFBC|nr:CHAT domain-containing protein [Geitlerinema sp. PCC 7407]AFY66271.1 YD repeat protein [Geitlerinema sp. PCC 7407]
MNTFEITIQRKSGAYWPIVVEHTRPGVLLPIRAEGFLQLTQEDFSELTSLLGQPRNYGTRLGKALFRDEVRDAFVCALRDSTEPLRVLLFIEAEDRELRSLRWERLCANIDDGWYLLAIEQRTPFSLYIPAITDRRFPPIGRRDLRSLVLVASPSGLGRFSLDSFDVEATVESVRQALGEIPCDVLATVNGAIGLPNLDELCKQLTDRTKQYTLLHVVCHGKLIEGGETVLYWAKADNSVEPVTGTRLLERLRSLRGARGLPHFAFFSTCESASSEAEEALGGLAQRLVRDLGMPAVVAMTEKVTIKTAQALAKSFYRQLKESGEVDLALNEATAGLAERHDITVPALFSRLGGRPLFSDKLDRDLTNAEIQFGLERLQNLLIERAPVLQEKLKQQADILDRTLGADATALSKEARQERKETLEEVNNLCDEVLDLSFNALALEQQPPKYDSRCPFRGLSPFRVEDQEFFFGRDRLIEQLRQKLTKHNFLAVLGASGSGKSSVLLAGLIPQLQSQQPNLQLVYLTPSSEPLVQLNASLSHLTPEPSVLLVDQFEELFTLCTDEAKRVEFIDRLLNLAQQQKTIITMRADFWGECASHRQLKELMQARQELIAPMDSGELRKAIEMQASHVHLRFEAGLSHLILDEVQGEPGAMPLLQHALLELWKRRHGRWLRCKEYEAIGGVRMAIAKTADDVYNSLPSNEQDQVRDIFVRLTRLDESTVQGEKRRDTRRRVWLDELVPKGGDLTATKQLVKRLADEGARLVVTSTGPATNKETVEVAHEALIRYWPSLQQWLEENRSNLQLREAIRQAALDWDENQRKEEYLEHRGGRLEDAEVLSKQTGFLNQLEAEYVDACVELRDRQRRKEKRQFMVVSIFSIVASALAVFSTILYRRAEIGQITALRQTSEARFAVNRYTVDGLLVGLDAASRFQSLLWGNPRMQEDMQATLAAAGYWTREHNRLKGHQATVQSVRFSPNGDRLATASYDNTVNLWHSDGRLIKILKEHTEPVVSVSFSPNGQTIASGSQDGTVRLWDRNGNPIRMINTHKNTVFSVQFSPDGQTIATGSDDGTVQLWRTDGQLLNTIQGHSNVVRGVSFSPDGNRIVTISDDRTVKLWRRDGTLQKILSAHTDVVTSADFSPDGEMFATASLDRKVKLWSQEGQLLETLDHPQEVWSVRFSRDGQTIASSSTDGSVNLWARDGRKLDTWAAHEGQIPSVDFSPDGQMLVTASNDKLTKIWQVNRSWLTVLVGHNGFVNSVQFSPDGKWVVSAGSDKMVRLWSPSGKLLSTLKGHQSEIYSVSFSPDGQTIASASNDETVRLWSVERQALKILQGHQGAVNQVSFSPDGQIIASVSDDATARLWRSDGTELRTFRGHQGRVLSVSFSPNGQIIATAGDDRTVRLWGLDGKELKIFREHTNPVRHVSFSPNGQIIASASSDESIKLWSLDGKVIATLRGHTAAVLEVSFSPDGQTIASASSDRTIKLWRRDGTLITTLIGHQADVNAVSFSPDNQWLASADLNGVVLLWKVSNLNLKELLEKGCSQIRDYLKTQPNSSHHFCN